MVHSAKDGVKVNHNLLRQILNGSDLKNAKLVTVAMLWDKKTRQVLGWTFSDPDEDLKPKVLEKLNAIIPDFVDGEFIEFGDLVASGIGEYLSSAKTKQQKEEADSFLDLVGSEARKRGEILRFFNPI